MKTGKRKTIGMLFAAVLLLAALGCWFCRRCPMKWAFRAREVKAAELGMFGTCPVRGTILAADGTVLAEKAAEWLVHIDPQSVNSSDQTRESVVAAVAEGLSLPVEQVRAAYAQKKSRYVSARSGVTGAMLDWCQRHAHEYGLVVEKVQARRYPLGAEAFHVTGLCNNPGPGDSRLRGSYGLECVCNGLLSGVPGVLNRQGTRAENLRSGKPKDGGTVRTTVRAPVQKAMSRILDAAVTSNRAESAWALAVKVPSGEIVAMSSWPTMAPQARQLSVEQTDILHNGAVQTLHEPGGLMKPLVYAMAVEAGCIRPDAIADFSNTTFTNLCLTMGTNVIQQGLVRLQVGKRLGKNMIYGEESGFVNMPKLSDGGRVEIHNLLARFFARGLGHGCGVAMTGLQLAQAYATLANGGVRVTPYLVESMTDASGQIVWSHAAEPEERFVSAETAAAVTKLLLGQTNGVARVAGVTVAGKASTFPLIAKPGCHLYSDTDFDALYAGYFPVEKPEYALVVAFRKPRPEQAAEKVALPAFEAIARNVLECGTDRK